MDATTAPAAWQPLTPRGIAAFAHGRLRRLLLVQLIVALLVGITVAWLLHDGIFPTVTSAIEQLPSKGKIRATTLDWHGVSPQLLAEGRFLSLAVDLDHSGTVRSLSHFQIEFGRSNMFIHSLLGYSTTIYPNGWIIEFNRTELEPRWGAWRPVLLVLTAAAVAAFLVGSWFVLAMIYCGPVWLLGFFANRDLSLPASWKLSGAALMPGALAMEVSILFYGLGWLDLVQMGFAFVVHLLLGWGFLVASLFFVSGVGKARSGMNPFARARK